MDDLAWQVLTLCGKRALVGATREDLFQTIKGFVYDELMASINDLKDRGYVTVEYLWEGKFVVTITEKGSVLVRDEYEKRLKAYEERIQEERRTAGLERI